VNQSISHAGHVAPGNVRLSLAHRFRLLLSRLTNDFNAAYERSLERLIAEKRFKIDFLHVLGKVVQLIKNVLKKFS